MITVMDIEQILDRIYPLSEYIVQTQHTKPARAIQ